MKSMQNIFLYIGLLLLTIGYCWLIWLGFIAYSAYFPANFYEDLPFITRITIYHQLPFPYHALPWQLLAVLSLILNFLWGLLRSKKLQSPDASIRPAICHIGWIVLSICWHGVGIFSSFITIISQIG